MPMAILASLLRHAEYDIVDAGWLTIISGHSPFRMLRLGFA